MRWLTDLRRKIELFNRCVTQCDNENSMRMEMSEIFSPLLGILHESIMYLQRHSSGKQKGCFTGGVVNHNSDDDFVKFWPARMEQKVKDFLDSMESTIKHLKSMDNTSRVNQAQSLSVALGMRDRETEKDGAEKAIFPVVSLPLIFRTDKFTGRDREIEKIHEQLGSADANRLQTYLIYGRRGIGKTQIALEFSHRYRQEYDAIFWIQCETSASLRTSFADIAVALELDGADKNGHFEENLMKVLGWLKRTRKRWLLIYDNAERENLLKGYWPVGARGSILLTSRSFYNFFEDEQRHGETIPLFNEAERRELLMAHLGEDWQAEHFAAEDMMVQVEKAAITTLLERTGGLPLAIFHAAQLVKNKKIGKIGDTSVRGFLELFNENFKKLPKRQTGPREPLFHSLDTIWSIAFEALKPHPRALLHVFALLSPDETLIDLFLPSDQSKLTEKLDFCRTGSGDLVTRPTIQTVISPSAALQNALDELRESGFISRAGRLWRIHREVQEAVNYREVKDLKDSFDAVINLLYDAFPKQEGGRPMGEQWDACRRWTQDVVHVANKYWVYTQGRAENDEPLKDLRSADLLGELLSNCAW